MWGLFLGPSFNGVGMYQVGIRLTGDGSALVGELGKVEGANQRVARSFSDVERAASGIEANVSRMAAAVAGALSVRELVQAADGWATINAQLKLATGSSLAAAAAYEEVYRIALQSGQGLAEVSSVYKKIADNAAGLGMTQAQVAAATETVARAVALSGASAGASQAALQQFGQALGSGVLRGDEFNSVLEQTPRLMLAIADGMGVPIGKLRELAEAGSITSDAIVKALAKTSDKVADEFGKLPLTVSRGMTEIKSALTDKVGDFEKSTGVFSVAAKALDGLAHNMDMVVVGAGAVAGVYAGKVVAGMAGATAATLAQIQADQAARVSAASLAEGELRRAAAAEVQAASELARAQSAVAAVKMEIAADRERIASTALVIKSEIELEKIRLAAQINDIGRAQRVGEMANLSRQLAALQSAEASVGTRLAAVNEAQAVAAGNAAAAKQRLAAAAATLDVANTAVATGSGLASRALSAMGGPIGLVTTALTLGATAWMVWGDKAKESTADAARSAVESIESITSKLQEMNGRLADTTRQAYSGMVAAGESELKTARAQIAYYQVELEKLDNQGGRGRFTEAGKDLQAQLNRYAADEIRLQQELQIAREKSAQVGVAGIDKFVDANAVGAEKVRVKQSKLLQEFSQAIAQTGGVLDLSIAAHKRAYDALQAGLADAAKDSKGSDALKSATEAAKQYAAELDATAEKGEKLGQAEKALADAHQKLSAAQFKQIEPLLLSNVAKEKSISAAEKAKKVEEEWAKRVDATLAPLERQAEALETQVEFYGMTESAIQRVLVARKEEALETARGMEGAESLIASLEREVEVRKRIVEAAGQKDALDANKKAADATAEYWTRVEQDIERALTDSLFRGLEAGGKSGAKVARDSILAGLKVLPIKLAVQALVTPVFSSLKDAAQGQGASAGNALGAASNATGLFGGSAGNGLIVAGNALGSSSLGLLGTGANIGWSAANTAAIAYSEAGMATEGLLLQAGAAMPYLAAALAAYQLADSMFGSQGGPKSEVYGGSRSVDWGLAATAPTSSSADAMAAALQTQFDQVLASFGKSAQLRLGVGGDADPSGTAGSRTGYYVSVDGQKRFGETAVSNLDDAALAAAGQRALLAALEATNINAVVDKYLDSLDVSKLTADQTAAALATVQSFQQIDQALADLGFGAGALTADMVSAAGGVDALKSSVAAYYEQFATDEEKRALAANRLNDQFKALGIEMPVSAAGFKALVSSLDRTTSAGQQTFVKLMALASAFSEVTTAANDALTAAYSTSQSDVDAALANVRRAIDAEKTRAQAALDAANEQVAAVQGVFDALEAGVRNLYGLVPQTSAMLAAEAQNFIKQAVVSAQAGYLPDADALAQAIQAATGGIVDGNYASSVDAARARLQLAGQLEAINAVTKPQLSAAAQAAEAAKAQLTALDGILASTQAQVDAARGTAANVLTVAGAIKQLESALVGELRTLASVIIAGLQAGTTGPGAAVAKLKATGSSIAYDAWSAVQTSAGVQNVWASSGGAAAVGNTIYAVDGRQFSMGDARNFVQGAVAANKSTAIYEEALKTGISAASLDALMGWSAGTANSAADALGLPKFDVGTNRVQRDMLAMIHKDEAIIPAAFNPWAGGGGSGIDVAGLLKRIDKLQSELEELRLDQRDQAVALSGYLSRSARVLDKWDVDGMPGVRS